MIAFLSGTIEYLDADTVIIDVGGVGYEVKISAEVSGALSAVGTGNAVKLYTYTYLREDQIALYGFRSRDDLALFRQLITVSGIGPKGGLSLLSAMSADDLRFAIVSGDARMISRAPGVGKKTAERLILDLRDRISSGIRFCFRRPGCFCRDRAGCRTGRGVHPGFGRDRSIDGTWIYARRSDPRGQKVLTKG